jgi:hypothetical protein
MGIESLTAYERTSDLDDTKCSRSKWTDIVYMKVTISMPTAHYYCTSGEGISIIVCLVVVQNLGL